MTRQVRHKRYSKYGKQFYAGSRKLPLVRSVPRFVRRPPIIPLPNYDDSRPKKIVKSLRDNASEIADRITDVLEYGYAFSTGDVFTLIKNKGLNKGISLATDQVCEQIDNSGIYENLKEEYNLSNAEIITVKQIIKEIIQKVIEYISEKIIDYIDSKTALQWAEEALKEHIQKNIKDYFSNTYSFLESNRIRNYFTPNLHTSLPSEIRIKAKQEVQRKTVKDIPIIYKLHPFICYYANIDHLSSIIDYGIQPRRLGESKIIGIKIYVLENGLNDSQRRKEIHRLISIQDKIVLVIKPRLEFSYYNSELHKAYTKEPIQPRDILAAIIHESIKQKYPEKIRRYKEKLKDNDVKIYSKG